MRFFTRIIVWIAAVLGQWNTLWANSNQEPVKRIYIKKSNLENFKGSNCEGDCLGFLQAADSEVLAIDLNSANQILNIEVFNDDSIGESRVDNVRALE